MDELDSRLIVELQKDPRQSNTHLAMSLGVVEATVRRRIDNLVSSGTILLTALPDLAVFGYPTRVYIMLQVRHSKLEKIGEQLCHMPCLRFVSYCVGSADLFVRGDFTSVKAMADFTMDELGKMPGISRIETMLEYEGLKQTHNRIAISRLDRTATSQIGDIAISEADRRLIIQLQKNARAPLKELAQGVGVSEATIHRRIKELVSSGAIELTAIPDNAKVGYPVRCQVCIQTEPARVRRVAGSVAQYPQATYVGLISGTTQILVGINASSAEGVSEFVTQELSNIKGIVRVESLAFLKVLKRNFTWLNE